MSGRTVPAIFLPRYTTYAGAGDFTTMPVDVTAFEQLELVFWRGAFVGTNVVYNLYLEVSGDQDEWQVLNPPGGLDPGAKTASSLVQALPMQYLRLRTNITGTGATVTSYAYGNLVMRHR